MKTDKTSLTYHPFEEMKDLLEANAISLPEDHAHGEKIDCYVEEDTKLPSEPDENTLFSEAMKGVKPIPRDNCLERVFQVDLPNGSRSNEDAEVLARLTELVRSGIGFNIFDTPEYIEGTGYNIRPDIARRLHRGEFSIQAHVDLHGLISEDAREVFETFLKWAAEHGKRGVLIIHGRGLSSPSEPVLKKKVVEWLTQGPWRKWVVAYASARSCDGGAGATYVLLRQRPASKRIRTRRERRRSNHTRSTL